MAQPADTTIQRPMTGHTFLERLHAKGLLPPLCKGIRLRADIEGIAYVHYDCIVPEELAQAVEEELEVQAAADKPEEEKPFFERLDEIDEIVEKAEKEVE